MTKRNWICSSSPPEAWQSRAHVRRRSCGARFEIPTVSVDSFTMCQTAFSVIPSPHALPTLLTLRNTFPLSMAAATSQLFTSFRTQSGTGTVRTWPPLPTDRQSLSAPHAAEDDPVLKPRPRAFLIRMRAAVPTRHGRVFLSIADGWAPPKRMALLCREPVPETHAQFLDALNSANASGGISTEQTAVGAFACESAYCAKAQIDCARCELTGFEMRPIAQHHYPVERQAWF